LEIERPKAIRTLDEQPLFKDFWLKRRVVYDKAKSYQPKNVEPQKIVPKVGMPKVEEEPPKLNLIIRPREKVRNGLFDRLSELVEKTREEMARRRILRQFHKRRNSYDFSKKFKEHS